MANLERQLISGMMMPIHFGARFSKMVGSYGDVTTLSVTYLTDKRMLTKHLPECFEIVGEPLVKVYYAMNREVGWLAGACYNMLGVDVPCFYRGKQEEMPGKFCLVLWENLTDPILTGRELQGIPKIFANIEDHMFTEGEWRTSAHYRGHKMVDISIKEERPMTQEEIGARRKAPGQDWFGWKSFPKTGEEGTDISYPTLYPLGDFTREGWWGTGKVQWHRLTWEQNPTQFHIVNALEELPILEYREAFVAKSGIGTPRPGAPAPQPMPQFQRPGGWLWRRLR